MILEDNGKFSGDFLDDIVYVCARSLVHGYIIYMVHGYTYWSGCTECSQAFLGQKICPEKKLENGFFPKIDVAIVGWHRSFKLDLAPVQ